MIIIKWILNTVDQELGKEQVRFREGKKCGELIFSFKISSGNAQSGKDSCALTFTKQLTASIEIVSFLFERGILFSSKTVIYVKVNFCLYMDISLRHFSVHLHFSY